MVEIDDWIGCKGVLSAGSGVLGGGGVRLEVWSLAATELWSLMVSRTLDHADDR
jgi:hypothetical protein